MARPACCVPATCCRPRWSWPTPTGFRTDPVLPFFLERYASAYRAELDAFVAAVGGGTPARPDGEDGLRALLLADAALESSRTGGTVRPAEV